MSIAVDMKFFRQPEGVYSSGATGYKIARDADNLWRLTRQGLAIGVFPTIARAKVEANEFAQRRQNLAAQEALAHAQAGMTSRVIRKLEVTVVKLINRSRENGDNGRHYDANQVQWAAEIHVLIDLLVAEGFDRQALGENLGFGYVTRVLDAV